MTTTPRVSLEDLRAAAHHAEAEAVEAEQARRTRDALALSLYEAGGVTYGDLAGALGVTRDRVSQVLAEQRKNARARETA